MKKSVLGLLGLAMFLLAFAWMSPAQATPTTGWDPCPEGLITPNSLNIQREGVWVGWLEETPVSGTVNFNVVRVSDPYTIVETWSQSFMEQHHHAWQQLSEVAFAAPHYVAVNLIVDLDDDKKCLAPLGRIHTWNTTYLPLVVK